MPASSHPKSYYSKSAKFSERLAADLDGIFSGQRQLPPISELTERYSTSRHNVRQAIDVLEQQGRLRRVSSRRIEILPATGGLSASSARLPKVISFAFVGYQDFLTNHLVQGIGQYASRQGLRFQLINSTESFTPVCNALAAPWQFCGDGVILMPFDHEKYTATFQQLHRLGFPMVVIGSEIKDVPFSFVGGDDFGGTFFATMELIRRYGQAPYFLYDFGNNDVLRRRLAYEKAMQEAGMGEQVATHTLYLGDESGQPTHWGLESQLGSHWVERICDILPDLPRPASIVCVTDYIALNLYEAARRCGLRVGTDLKVIGFGNNPQGERVSPPLSTIGIDGVQLGFQAAKLLHSIITCNLNAPIHIHVPFTPIHRGSD